MISQTRLFIPVFAALAAVTAFAHVTVQPKEATAGATQKYTMRVPNEKTVDTIRLEAEFPAEAQVQAVDPKDGWKIELKKDAAGKITGAVWTGAIEPKDIAEFTFSAVNPKDETKLVWKVVQVYKDGAKSEWTGPAGSKGPAPVTQIKP